MQRVSVKLSKKTAVRVDEVVIPHDSGTFLGRNNQVGCMTVYTQIIFNRFCIFKVLEGNKKRTNWDTVAAWHEIVNFISVLFIAIAVRTLLLYAHGPMTDSYFECLLNSSKHECWQNLHRNLLREYNLYTDSLNINKSNLRAEQKFRFRVFQYYKYSSRQQTPNTFLHLGHLLGIAGQYKNLLPSISLWNCQLLEMLFLLPARRHWGNREL